VGSVLAEKDRDAVARQMARTIRTVIEGGAAEGYMRLGALGKVPASPTIVVSGGVSEFMAGHDGDTGDLGPDLSWALKAELADAALTVATARQGIRATVVGASQYTVQVSGSTIFLDPDDALPLRNLAVIAPVMALGDEIDPDGVAASVAEALARLDLQDGHAPVAVALPWSGTASYARLRALGQGLVAGLDKVLGEGHPLVIVTDGDVGGLIGMQCRSEEPVPGAIVSIDGIALSEFDFIDIGEVLRATGATPVVVKSLLFPTE
jgi:ethanolamine utilization protein EutA